ncbi:MAG: Dam family site-specific DNA-(adenine-N6)-methyltransferase [Deltaproteobacteria bacterium]|nr:Dam family site-specific DNA-(adenine-N6)-methyltransferase [Deltaproteobacteria bacterium]
MKPILKWAGGKARLAPQISTVFGQTCEGTYYEPFLGAAAVYLYRKARGEVGRAVLSDINEKLVEVHRAVRDDADGVIAALDRLPDSDWRERYYDIRDDYNRGPWRSPLHAARFIWLNRAGFNGLYRENRKGEFNVPVGRYTHLAIPSPEHIREVGRLLQGAELVSGSFAEVIGRAGEGDQVYCDPPYVPLSASASFTGYHSSPFGLAEQKSLAHHARVAGMRGARVVLSNHDLPVVRNEIYPEISGFEHVARPRVARAISRNAGSREAVAEVIAAIGPAA